MGEKSKKKGLPKGHCNSTIHGGYMRLSKRKLDGRSKLAKALKQIKGQIIVDIGNDPTQTQLLLVDRIGFKAMRLCFWELAVASGEVEVNDKYIALSNSFRQDLQLLGLERKEKDYVPLKDYLEVKDKKGGE